MPMDGPEDLASEVICKQIGGQSLEVESGYWQILFPSSEARIDGRVPTQPSTQYLITTRMNPSRELIAVVFTPQPEKDAKFNDMIEFFTKKESVMFYFMQEIRFTHIFISFLADMLLSSLGVPVRSPMHLVENYISFLYIRTNPYPNILI